MEVNYPKSYEALPENNAAMSARYIASKGRSSDRFERPCAPTQPAEWVSAKWVSAWNVGTYIDARNVRMQQGSVDARFSL